MKNKETLYTKRRERGTKIDCKKVKEESKTNRERERGKDGR